jgi:hypothetical protein
MRIKSKFWWRSASVALLALVMMLSGIGSAMARPLERFRFHDYVVTDQADFCDIEGLGVRETLDAWVNVTVVAQGPDDLAYFKSTANGSLTWTNVDTGDTLRSVFNIVDKDHKVIDNGDGTITVIVLATGGERWYGPDGKLLFMNPGQIRFELLIDETGEAEFVGVVKGSTGRNDLEDRDFCEDIETFIG